jgi:hypothetical protein
MTRILLPFVCLVASFLSLQAQNWTVGVPVYRTIIDYPDRIFVTRFCDSLNAPNGQDAELILALPAVAGIAYYLHVDDATSPNHTYRIWQGSNVQILQQGDSMLLASTATTDTVHIGYAGFESEVSVRFKALGTPTVQGEHHPCGSTNDGWYNQPIGCLGRTWADTQTYLLTCTVQGPTAADAAASGAGIQVWPQPARGRLYMRMPEDFQATHLQLTDLNGRVIAQFEVEASPLQTLDLQGIPAGLYFLHASEVDGQRFEATKVLLED